MDETQSQPLQTQATAPGQQPSGQQPPPSAPAARPAYIAEKFWDAEKGAPRVEDLGKAHQTLESERGKFKETLTAEINAERFKGRPGKADDYKFAVPETVKDLVLLDKAPDATFQPEAGKTYALLNPASPLMKGARELAYEYGVPAEKLNGLVLELARETGMRAPTAEEAQAQRGEFLKSLGDQGEARFNHVANQLKAAGADLDVSRASLKEFEAVEKLLEKTGQARFTPGNATVPPSMSREELRAIQAEPDFDINKEKQKRVAEGYARLFPGQVNIADHNRNVR